MNLSDGTKKLVTQLFDLSSIYQECRQGELGSLVDWQEIGLAGSRKERHQL